MGRRVGWRSRQGLWVIMGAVLLIVGCSPSTNAPTTATLVGGSPTTITSAPSCVTPTGTPVPLAIQMNTPPTKKNMLLATNIVNTKELSPSTSPLAQSVTALLQQWQPGKVRLHMGFSYGSYTLPESKQGEWDFTDLDATISQLRALHIEYYLEVRTGPPWMYDAAGQLRDQSFGEFATYITRLVSWYNKGGFTDDKGQFHASGHTNWVHEWEIWNEPNSGFEIPAPVADRPATWMSAQRFARLFDVANWAMRKVDPTIATGGPTISSYPDIPYLRDFITSVQSPLDFLTFHYYAVGKASDTDAALFAAADGPRLYDRLVAANQIIASVKPGLPIWIDEVGVNEASYGTVDGRGTSPLSYAFFTQVFVMAQNEGIALLGQFPLVGTVQFGLLDSTTLKSYRTLWFMQRLAGLFPPGIGELPITGLGNTGLIAMAAIAPDGKHLRVLIGNRRVLHANDVGGTGSAATVKLTFAGNAHLYAVTAGSTAQVWGFDATTSPQSAPTPCQATATDNALTVTVGGYGATMLDLPLSAAP